MKMSRVHSFYRSILLIACFLCHVLLVYGQNGDINLLRKINPNPPTSVLWKAVSNSSEPISVGIPIAMFATYLINHNTDLRWKSTEAVAAMLSVACDAEILKIVVHRQRPYQKYPDISPYRFEDGKSFPSGHASLAFSTATTLALEYKKWYIVIPAYAWATSVGYSRLYLGMHYPSDILASAVLGSATAWGTHLLAKKFLKKWH